MKISVKANNTWMSSAAVAAIAAGVLAAPAHAASISWETSLNTAMQKAKRAKKPVLLYFGATWCAPCKTMDKGTFKNASVAQESKKWVMLKLDGDKNQQLANKYKVLGTYPAFVFLKSNGTSVGKTVGYKNAQQMAQMLRTNATRAR